MNKLRPVFIALFCLGTLMFMMGQIITFVPRAERNWFLGAAAFTASGLLIKGRAFRLTAILLLILCIISAIDGH